MLCFLLVKTDPKQLVTERRAAKTVISGPNPGSMTFYGGAGFAIGSVMTVAVNVRLCCEDGKIGVLSAISGMIYFTPRC